MFDKIRTIDVDICADFDTIFSIDSPTIQTTFDVHSRVLSEYGRDIIKNLKLKETALGSPLSQHEIKPSHRKQMVVWMEEVFRTFACPDETFFLAVSIMDRYLQQARTKLVLTELHEIGVACMFLASKYQDTEPLTLALMVYKVSYGKISKAALLNREKVILAVLKFTLAKPTAYTFIESY